MLRCAEHVSTPPPSRARLEAALPDKRHSGTAVGVCGKACNLHGWGLSRRRASGGLPGAACPWPRDGTLHGVCRSASLHTLFRSAA